MNIRELRALYKTLCDELLALIATSKETNVPVELNKLISMQARLSEINIAMKAKLRRIKK
jgi:hypothetical protein